MGSAACAHRYSSGYGAYVLMSHAFVHAIWVLVADPPEFADRNQLHEERLALDRRTPGTAVVVKRISNL